MIKPEPNRHVITGLNTEGAPTPVAYRVTCRRPDEEGPGDVSLQLPYFLHWETRELREAGYEVIVEPLSEMPEELVETWMLAHLRRLMPPDQRKAFAELGFLAVNRADDLRSGRRAERRKDRLFVAVAPGDDDTVLDLVFTRGKPATYSRSGNEWVRSDGVGDYDYQSYGMIAVRDGVLDLYDERRRTGKPLHLAELREKGLLADQPAGTEGR